MNKRLTGILKRCVAVGECLEWQGCRDASGYGKCSDAEGRVRHAHRIVYELFHNKILDQSVVVRHKCDNRACCNPSHLEEGSQQDNVDDMYKRGRARKAVGTNHGNNVLTEDTVRQIRLEHQNGASLTAISKQFNTHTSNVWAIVHHKAWQHLV